MSVPPPLSQLCLGGGAGCPLIKQAVRYPAPSVPQAVSLSKTQRHKSLLLVTPAPDTAAASLLTRRSVNGKQTFVLIVFSTPPVSVLVCSGVKWPLHRSVFSTHSHSVCSPHVQSTPPSQEKPMHLNSISKEKFTCLQNYIKPQNDVQTDCFLPVFLQNNNVFRWLSFQRRRCWLFLSFSIEEKNTASLFNERLSVRLSFLHLNIFCSCIITPK